MINLSAQKVNKGQQIKLSIIIVNYNTRRLLRNCLQSIYNTASDLNIEVFVSDNASSDGSTDMIKTNFRQVRLIENHEDEGFTKAANKALARASGAYYLVSHPDIEYTPDCFRNMLNYLDAHEEVGVVGANCLYPDGSSVESACKRLSVVRECVDFACDSLDRISQKSPLVSSMLDRVRSRYYWDHQKICESDIVYFSCMIFRKELIEKIGYFCEDYFIWFADYDWCQRVLNSGAKIYWLPDAKVIHYEMQSQDFIDDERVRYKLDGSLSHHLLTADKLTLCRKYYNLWLISTVKIFSRLSIWRNRLGRAIFTN